MNRAERRAEAREAERAVRTRVHILPHERLSQLQVRDLAFRHLDQIAKGHADADTLWQWVAGILTWSKAAELIGAGKPKMAAQLEMAHGVIDRFRRTGRVVFTGPEYQATKDAVGFMDQIAETAPGLQKYTQNKTGRRHQIALGEDLEKLLPKQVGNVRALVKPLVKRLDGGFYGYQGISSILREAIAAANFRRKARGVAPIPSFGCRDLKGKGATDMYFVDQVPIEQIQQLLGHADVRTTEIYIKARWRETARPNTVRLGV